MRQGRFSVKSDAKLGVVTPRILFSGQPILTSFLRIFEALYDEVFVISRGFVPETKALSQKVRIKNINYALRGEDEATLDRLIEYIDVPFSTCLDVLRLPKGTRTVVFLLGNITLTLPMLAAKLTGKRVVLVLTGLYSKNAEAFYKASLKDRIFLWGLKRVEGLNFTISDLIVGYTSNTVAEFNLFKYKDKISGTGVRFVDTASFKVTRQLGERKNLIGYIGRFRGEKGIPNFTDAIPRVLKANPGFEFSVVGDGPLFHELEQKIKGYSSGAISLVKWIPHSEVPDHLNRLKLLVIPSNSETGPYIALEAMACGTPVLSMPVGFVPDVIKDGDTGFILPDNSPESIARNIVRVLSHPRLEEIAGRAQKLVQARYSFPGAVARYRGMLSGDKQ